MMKKKCINCDEYGHLYKHCTSPLNSYGMILYRECSVLTEIEFLLVQRRHTFGYVELIRGSYDETNITDIERLISEMTVQERSNITTQSFDVLWKTMWYQDTITPKQLKYFKKSEEKFTKIFPMIVKIEDTLPKLWELPEWGFPKGKKEVNETILHCAQRECKEETNISENEYVINESLSPIEEIFMGTDGKSYRHVYYVAKMMDSVQPCICVDSLDESQLREIGNIQWFRLKDAIKYIRPYNHEKIDIMKYINKQLRFKQENTY